MTERRQRFLMSRTIKKYPYNEMFHDTLECDANTIADFGMPRFRIEFYNFQNNSSDGILQFTAHARAEEDEPGVYVKLVQEDAGDNPIVTPEIKVDEIKFVDEIYNIVITGYTAEDSKYMQDLIYQIGRDFALKELDKEHWCYRIEYQGFGIIKSKQEIISTIDTVVFDKRELRLNYCVGNSNLNKVDNCTIQFNCNDRCFELTDFTMQSVSSDSEDYCNYVLTDWRGKQIQKIDIPKEKFQDLVHYSSSDSEQFVEERLAIIEGSEKENSVNNAFADIEL